MEVRKVDTVTLFVWELDGGRSTAAGAMERWRKECGLNQAVRACSNTPRFVAHGAGRPRLDRATGAGVRHPTPDDPGALHGGRAQAGVSTKWHAPGGAPTSSRSLYSCACCIA